MPLSGLSSNAVTWRSSTWTSSSSQRLSAVGGRIIDVVDEILSLNPNAQGLAINWQIFGSSGLEKADYSKGVLERFTRRAKKNWVPFPKSDTYNGGNAHVKTIANPRTISSIHNPHGMDYFQGLYAINENGSFVKLAFNNPVTVEKIAINHYASKTFEEFSRKLKIPLADSGKPKNPDKFKNYDRNEEFDDEILKYRDERAKVYQPPKPRSNNDLIKALERNLPLDAPPDYYAGKIEIFLTCRAVAAYLQTKLADDTQAKFFEEASLKAIIEALKNSPSEADKSLLKLELPKILELPYPIVENFRKM